MQLRSYLSRPETRLKIRFVQTYWKLKQKNHWTWEDVSREVVVLRRYMIVQYYLKQSKHTGSRGGAVGWGTTLQAGRSWFRFPMVSLEFFTDVILRSHYDNGVDSISDINVHQEYLLWGKGGQCVGLTTLLYSCAYCPEIPRASISRNPKDTSRPVMG
jgi:hypothetical protein